MSTYSNLKIQLIGTGELPGTWGTATNVNWGSTGGGIQQAVVGMATISSGFTGSPLTLTLTLTDTAEAQNARALVLNLTQSLGSAGTLNVPAIQKPYMVINATGQTVTVKVTGQTGVAVPTGTRAFLYNNGTDVGVFMNYLPSLTLGTDLAVADGGTGISSGTSGGIPYFSGTTSMASSAALAANAIVVGGGAGVAPSTVSTASGILTWIQTPSSANLAAAVTDETGSGSLVFATSPTLVTPTLGVATATSVNKVALTAPATSATLTLADGSTLATSGANSLTLTTTGATNVTLPTSGTLATTAGSVASVSFGTTGLTPSTATSGAVTVAGTLIPANGGTGVSNGSNNTITFTGNYTLGLTLNNNTSLTLPTTGTLATLAGSETLTNKTLTSPVISAISNTGTVTLPTSTTTLVGRDTTDTLTNKSISGSANTLSNIANASLTNSSVSFNGVAVALGASGTITAANPNAITISTGLQLNTGTTYDGSAARTLSVDSTVVTLTGSQTLTNKTLTLPGISAQSGGGSQYIASGLIGSNNLTVALPAENMTVGFRNVPGSSVKTTAYTLEYPTGAAGVGDIGKVIHIGSGGSIVIPNNTFNDGDVISVFNQTNTSKTITCNTTTGWISGSTTVKGGGGTITLAAYGVATILFYSSTACVVSGSVT